MLQLRTEEFQNPNTEADIEREQTLQSRRWCFSGPMNDGVGSSPSQQRRVVVYDDKMSESCQHILREFR